MNKTPIVWDPSLLFNAPKSYLYDPTPTGKTVKIMSGNNEIDTGEPLLSPNAYTQNYVLRSGKMPSTMIKTDSDPFSIQIIKASTGEAINVSTLSSSEIAEIYSGSFKLAFNACTADPTCYAIAVKNNQPAGSIGATYGNALDYILTLYQKPNLINQDSTSTNTPASPYPPTYDPIERLSCDPDKNWYTFLKNTPGAINPAGELSCPAIVPTPTITTNTNKITFAPSTRCMCPEDPTTLKLSDRCYYYCNPKIPPKPSMWSNPNTWIILFIIIAIIGGVGYYFYRKRQSEITNVDYNKFFKKKGGYFFFN